MKRHSRESYFIVGEGLYQLKSWLHDLKRRHEYGKESKPGDPPSVPSEPVPDPRPGDVPEMRKFRFSRMGPVGDTFDRADLLALAQAMNASSGADASSSIPAGFTYLGQFIDHDLTFDRTAAALGSDVTIDELIQGRSPALDLDCVYGRGPADADDRRFYTDGIRLKMGRTIATPVPAGTNSDRDGFDLPRVGSGSSKAERRAALIPDHRNDENLIVAQTHLAWIRFHNRIVDSLALKGTPSADLFNQARELAVKHYQWMIKTDFLPRIVDPAIVDDVFANGRKFFEANALPESMPTMPIEFSVAAYRMGHSMVREAYEWNLAFGTKPGSLADASLMRLFNFSGTSGTLSPDGTFNDPESGRLERLPTNWIADFRRLYSFADSGRPDLAAPPGTENVAKVIDTLLVDPLKNLPEGAISGNPATPAEERSLAFRNLLRANMVRLASGQQMAQLLGVPALTPAQVVSGTGQGASLPAGSSLGTRTPLWFYVLREAELNGGKLGAVGGRIVAETFHRAMEGSQHSIVRDAAWRPNQELVVAGQPARPDDRFTMTDLLLFAFEGKAELLNPLGDGAARTTVPATPEPALAGASAGGGR